MVQERSVTEQNIRDTFIAALHDHPLYSIKDSELASAAHVSLTTYYRYYDADKQNLLKSIEQDLIDGFKDALSEAFKPWIKLTHSPSKKDIVNHLDESLDSLIKYGKENREVLLAISSSNGDPGLCKVLLGVFANKMRSLLTHYYRLYNQDERLEKKELYFKLVTYRYALDIVGTLHFWLAHQDDMTIVECKEMVCNVVMYSSYDFTTHLF